MAGSCTGSAEGGSSPNLNGGYSLACRPKGPKSRRPEWYVGRLRNVWLSYFWRPWGRHGKLRWTPAKGRRVMTGADINREWEDRMPKKIELEKMPDLRLLGPSHGAWHVPYPELASWLCDTVYTDGSPKGDATLTLRRSNAQVMAMLKIEDGSLCMRSVGDTPDEALIALELLLTSEKPPWEIDTYPLGQRKGKRK